MKAIKIIIPKVSKALADIDSNKENLFVLLKQVANIPSPTFSEKEKILFLQNQLLKLGYQATIDAAGNLYGNIGDSSNKGKKLLVTAHTDTVLKPITEVRDSKQYFFGHGVCDNSTGLVALLTVLALVKKFKLTFPGQLVFGFTVSEEGLGGKRGMKFLLAKVKNIDAVVNLESHNLGRIINQSPGQYRLEINIEAEKGGHSFRDFGNSNAIVLISRFIAEFSQLSGFKKKETTFNIGKIEAGEGINAIAKKGRFLLEIRSLKQEKLDYFKQQLKKLEANFFNPNKGIKLSQKVFADSKAAFLPRNHKIYQLTREVHNYLGLKSFFEMGNNDAEIALAKGIPAVTIGSSVGYKTHSLDEYVDKNSLTLGIKQDLLVILNILHNL